MHSLAVLHSPLLRLNTNTQLQSRGQTNERAWNSEEIKKSPASVGILIHRLHHTHTSRAEIRCHSCSTKEAKYREDALHNFFPCLPVQSLTHPGSRTHLPRKAFTTSLRDARCWGLSFQVTDREKFHSKIQLARNWGKVELIKKWCVHCDGAESIQAAVNMRRFSPPQHFLHKTFLQQYCRRGVDMICLSALSDIGRLTPDTRGHFQIKVSGRTSLSITERGYTSIPSL